MEQTGKTYKVRLSGGGEFGPGDMELMVKWAKEGRIPRDSLLMDVQSGELKSVLAIAELARVVDVPPTVQGPVQTEAVGKAPMLIPYHNTPALVGYYCAVFALLPIAGMVLGAVAVVLGAMGYRKYRENPAVKGRTHSWVAMIGGGLIVLGQVLVVVLIASR